MSEQDLNPWTDQSQVRISPTTHRMNAIGVLMVHSVVKAFFKPEGSTEVTALVDLVAGR